MVGQDGLVANVAKYLTGQPVIGVNPDPELYDGVLVPASRRGGGRPAGDGGGRPRAHRGAHDGRGATRRRPALLALNEIFVGHRTHQSARYRIACGGGSEEAQCSSGVIVATGTGATGWARSIARQRQAPLRAARAHRAPAGVLRARAVSQRRHRHRHRTGDAGGGRAPDRRVRDERAAGPSSATASRTIGWSWAGGCGCRWRWRRGCST